MTDNGSSSVLPPFHTVGVENDRRRRPFIAMAFAAMTPYLRSGLINDMMKQAMLHPQSRGVDFDSGSVIDAVFMTEHIFEPECIALRHFYNILVAYVTTYCLRCSINMQQVMERSFASWSKEDSNIRVYVDGEARHDC